MPMAKRSVRYFLAALALCGSGTPTLSAREEPAVIREPDITPVVGELPVALPPEVSPVAGETPAELPPKSMDKPPPLNRPLEPFSEMLKEMPPPGNPEPPIDPPLGFAGKSRVQNRSGKSGEFQTMEDRWRIGFPEWDRYNQGFPFGIDYPYKVGEISDPYNQNVLKGDYPILGQNIFLNITGTSSSLFEFRQLPTATTPFESTRGDGPRDFFGKSGQFVYNQLFLASFDLFQGDAAFKPPDWRVKLTPAVNYNGLVAQELGVVSPDVRDGLTRYRGWVTLQEWFAELKLADTSPQYDFVSARVGAQPFTSDFRGFIYSDTNAAIRIFGTDSANRAQYNFAVFRQLEKDTNSMLNSFEFRNQTVAIANYYYQDFIFPGYTAEASIHYNEDGPSAMYDRNKFLVRPDPVGVFQQHRVQAVYLGAAGDGHIDRFNISNAAYWVLGRDSLNPLAGRDQRISAQMAALEVSYDRDWARFRLSGFYASGDGKIGNGIATGFDTILDNPAFAGGEFSFWQRQQIPLFGVNVSQRNSLVPDLRSSKIQGQSNFVNPGLWLANAGLDLDLTPKLRMINNANFLWFDKTAVLEQFIFQGQMDREIGVDLSSGFEYRPLLSNNVIFLFGASTLLPANGFRQLYNRLTDHRGPLAAAFMEVVLTY
ncbi:hypothetical protein [Zavarzinella formosa]|uniref:hypothetical protein n=1 Tax=Zavarzinella formosa TaxID=360055 RepID=UPI0002E9A169|nr:hypothetical protein [Zavarzinella formosa]